MSAKNPKCPICHNEYFIVKDIVFTGLGKQGYPFGKKAYISKCSKCGYHDVEDVTKYVEDLRGRGENL